MGDCAAVGDANCNTRDSSVAGGEVAADLGASGDSNKGAIAGGDPVGERVGDWAGDWAGDRARYWVASGDASGCLAAGRDAMGDFVPRGDAIGGGSVACSDTTEDWVEDNDDNDSFTASGEATRA